MRIKILSLVLLLCAIANLIFSQTYSTTDSLALLAIDDSCDGSDYLNWNTEPDPEKWVGVTWNAEDPKKVTALRVNDKALTGTIVVTTLTNLTYLECSNNQLAGLDVSTSANLTYLSCYNNQITELDVSQLINLTDLICSSNQISELDVSNLTNLTYLGCSANQINTLDVSGLVNLTYLACNLNKIEILDVSKLTGLTELYCQANHITTLNVSELTNLTTLICYNNELTTLDLLPLINLTELYCYSNQLTGLNLSSLANLTRLNCSINPISELDVSYLTNLTFLSCYSNQLTTLDVSALTKLTDLVCAGNELTGLDVSSLSNLAELICNSNQIMSLDVSANTNLTGLYCYDNELTELDASELSKLEFLECQQNRLPFSSLATGLHADNYIHSPQDIIFESQSLSGNVTLDYSDEALIEGTATEFKFFKDVTESASNTTGLYTTTGNGDYYCTMTNEKFPGLTLTTAPVTITGITEIVDNNEFALYFFPNPAKDIVHIHFNLKLADYILIELYTTNGILICQPFNSRMEPARHDIAIDLTRLPKGIYMMKLRTGNEFVNKKLILL